MRNTIVALAATTFLLAGGALATGASAASPTYWTFKSNESGACLTAAAGSTAVFTTACQGWEAQQWDWVGPTIDFGHELKSRSTGLCLTTDEKSDRNQVWQSACDEANGKFWNFSSPNLWTDAGSGLDGLRVSPGYTAVYSSNADIDFYDYGIPYVTHQWTGWHN